MDVQRPVLAQRSGGEQGLVGRAPGALAPPWLVTEGFTKCGCAEVHLLTMRVASERCSEWGDETRVFKVDLSDVL